MIINRRFQTPAFKKSSFMQRIFISDAKLHTAPNVPELLGGCRPTSPIDATHNKSDRLLTRTGGPFEKQPSRALLFFFLGKQLAYWLAACGRDGGWRRRWWRPSIPSERRRARLARLASIAPLALITFLARRACYQGRPLFRMASSTLKAVEAQQTHNSF